MDSAPNSSRPNSESPVLTHSTLNNNATPSKLTISSSNLGSVGGALGTPGKMGKMVPRINEQPIYDELKTILGLEGFTTYKEAVGGFILGRINRMELMDRIGGILGSDQQKIRLHNQFLLTMFTNGQREPPPPGPAPFVSATNLPSSNTLSKPPTLPTEARLKSEVMALPSRDRKRIKNIPMSPPPSPPQAPILPPMGIAKPDIQIYSLPLHEFPDTDAIRMRMMPLVYDEGLRPTISAETVSFMTLAAEIFVKEVIGSVLERTKRRKRSRINEDLDRAVFGGSNQPNWGKKKNAKPFAGKMPARRPITYNPEASLGFPYNVPDSELNKTVTMDDIRLSVTLGENLIAQLPLATARIMMGAGGRGEDEYWKINEDGKVVEKVKPEETDGMDIDEDGGEPAWEGSSKKARAELKLILEDCLAMS